MPRRHLAVALLLSGNAATEVDALRRATGDPDVERIPAHITLIPPVNVRDVDLDAVLATLRDAAASAASFTAQLGPTATFLPTSPTLYLEVSGALVELIGLRESLRVGPFDRPATLPFVPHVTLRSPAAPEVLERARDALGSYRATVTFDRVTLLEETERSWRPLADASFGASRIVIGRGSLPLELAESDDLDPAATAFASREWHRHDEGAYGPGTRWQSAPFAFSARRGEDAALDPAPAGRGGGPEPPPRVSDARAPHRGRHPGGAFLRGAGLADRSDLRGLARRPRLRTAPSRALSEITGLGSVRRDRPGSAGR